LIELSKELRHAVRGWSKSPMVVAVTVVSLGLGIGVATTIVSVAHSLLFPPSSGLTEPEQLVSIYTTGDEGSPYGPSSFLDYQDIATSLTSVQGITASLSEPVALGDGQPQRIVHAARVSASYFSVVGVTPRLGRAFGSDDEASGEDRVAVISHELWTRELHADENALGRTLTIGTEPYTIVGVAPKELRFGNPLRPVDLWLPFGSARPSLLSASRDRRRLAITARLRDDASLEQLRAELDIVADNLHGDHPREFSDGRGEALALTALSERDARVTPDRRAVIAIVALFPIVIAALILLIACGNVATLFLARAEQRRRETAVRLALGASRRRLVSMFLIESLIPGLMSGAVGIGLAWAATRALATLSLSTVPIHLSFDIDATVVSFAVALAIGTTLVFGSAPALAATRPDLVIALKNAGGNGDGQKGRTRFRRALVVAQIAASLVLVVGSGLFYRGVQHAATFDLGFDADRIALTTKSVPDDIDSPEEARVWIEELLTRLRSQPEVVDAQAATAVELTVASAQRVPIVVDRYEGSDGRGPEAYVNEVTAGYLEMLDFELVRGRTLRDSDSSTGGRAAVVNDLFAERFWPNEDAIGESFFVDRTEPYTVVGIIRDGKFRDIDDPPAPYFWTPHRTRPSRVALLVKGRGDASASVGVLERAVDRSDGEVVRIPPRTLDSMIDLQFVFGRVATRVLAWGSLFGLVLAAIGIYGIVSFSVTCRKRELAVRVAVGAARAQIVRTVLREGLALTGIGLALGTAIALPLAQLVQAQLLGTSPADPPTLIAAVIILVAVALGASLGPARRASAIDPVQTLRGE